MRLMVGRDFPAFRAGAISLLCAAVSTQSFAAFWCAYLHSDISKRKHSFCVVNEVIHNKNIEHTGKIHFNALGEPIKAGSSANLPLLKSAVNAFCSEI
ncbi:hypothetical protein GCM10009304_07850 [Pseudomonas matsuisoli]|uniref:Secreted protein n=1 Tax=Pseudomonas matsuisoli TaxID=1515666 RepID=A0A917UTH4_9PSED|nr:hypothetical protein GCM10009304_07850 [Pseudomonas matsuisoli]